MNKRSLDAMDGAPSKRQKTDSDRSVAIHIESARHLQQLLTFQQDAAPQLRKGIKAFKTFLEGIVYAEDRSATTREQAILRDYLETQRPRKDADTDSPSLAGLMQTWSYASSNNNDGLQSAAASVIALLLKTISTTLDLRDFGLALCGTLLQPTQLKLISRGLAAPRQKEHLISPCLRLLTEITSFDGGVMAKRVWTTKTFTFDGKMIARNLALSRTAVDKEGAAPRPSVRSNAVRYVLTLFRYLSSAAKAELLRNSHVLRSLFEHLKFDNAEMCKEILDTIRGSILVDAAIPRINKSYVLNEQNLCSIAAIYRQEQPPRVEGSAGPEIRVVVHRFLRYVCTTPDLGALRPYAGWYPPGTDKEVKNPDDDDETLDIDLGLSSIEWYERYRSHVPVRNGTLAAFAQFLRPYGSVLESELLIEIFRATPELVADYFYKKSGFTFDPKLTATWIGYSAFLFQTISLPVPIYLGRKRSYGAVPPPVSVVVESILPQPLNQKVLERCLHQKVELITFFVVRILIVALNKLKKAKECFEAGATEHGSLWREASDRLIHEFSLRCPIMKEIIGTFRKTESKNIVQREACLRLLALYYEVIPRIAFEYKFDVSIPLAESLRSFAGVSGDKPDVDSTDVDCVDDELRLQQLGHLLRIAECAPDMRWWHKPEQLKFSTFTTLLKVVTTLPKDKVLPEMPRLLGAIVQENGIMQVQTQMLAFNALLATLTSTDGFEATDELFTFLDDSCNRLTRTPIKYQDDLDFLTGKSKRGPVSLLLLTLVEQWSFQLVNKEAKNIAIWLQRLLAACGHVGEDSKIIKKIAKQLEDSAEEIKSLRRVFEKPTDARELQASLVGAPWGSSEASIPTNGDSNGEHIPSGTLALDESLLSPPAEDTKHSALHRWQNKDVATAVSSGDLSALILCLSSQYAEVRRAALANLASFMRKLPRPLPEVKSNAADDEKAQHATKTAPHGGFPEGHQYYLLLGILTSTAAPLISADKAVPYSCTSYAAIVAGQILHDPLHPMYERVCRYHTKSPTFDVERMISWWVHQILYTPAPIAGGFHGQGRGKASPGEVAGDIATAGAVKGAKNEHHASLIFLVDYIFSSLQTEADLEILRRRNTLEPLLALAASPYLPSDIYQAVIRILWRVSFLDDGSNILIMRKGVIAWTAARIANRTRKESDKSDTIAQDIASMAGLRALVSRLWKTCDQERVEEWSDGTMKTVLHEMQVV